MTKYLLLNWLSKLLGIYKDPFHDAYATVAIEEKLYVSHFKVHHYYLIVGAWLLHCAMIKTFAFHEGSTDVNRGTIFKSYA